MTYDTDRDAKALLRHVAEVPDEQRTVIAAVYLAAFRERVIEEVGLSGKTPGPQWTSTPPTQPGWCWARHRVTLQAEAVLSAGPGRVLRAGGEGWGSTSEFDLWAGPIEAPPLPDRR
jgi:hypothetical protein